MSCKEHSDGGKRDRIKRYVESILDVYDLTPEERARCMEQAVELIAGLSVQVGEEKLQQRRCLDMKKKEIKKLKARVKELERVVMELEWELTKGQLERCVWTDWISWDEIPEMWRAHD